MMKKFLLLSGLLVSFSLFGEITQQTVIDAIGLPLVGAEPGLTHADLEKKLQHKGIKFNGSPVKRTAFINGIKILGIPAKELQIISDRDGKIEQIDIIYSNKGDTAKYIKSKIRDDASTLKKKLTDLFGSDKKEKFGSEGVGLKVSAWYYGDIKFLLEFVHKEYTILHIIYSGKVQIDRKSKEQITLSSLQKNIVRKDNGDVFIENIPMVNQGSKGYCAVASLERVLLYCGIKNVTQHQLADIANTGNGGGTNFTNLQNATNKVTKKYKFDVKSCGEINFKSIKKYIDLGVPILWCMYTNDKYYAIVQKSRAERDSYKDLRTWIRSLKKQNVPSRGGAHICIIVGYNKKTGEIAVSNSWGDNEIKPGWVPLKTARKVSQGFSMVLLPEK